MAEAAAPLPEMLPVLDPQGQVVTVPQASFKVAIGEMGYRPLSPEQFTQWEAAQAYKTPTQGAAAFGEGLLRGVAPVVGVGALHALGVTTPEATLAREEAHPVAAGAGQAIGTIAPIVATMGAAAPEVAAGQAAEQGLLRTAAKYTAPAALQKVGAAVAGEAPGIARLAGAAALEGALYGGAEVAERAYLGDPSLTGEKALATIGLSAALPGALVGVGGATLKGLNWGLGKVKGGLETVAQRMAKGDEATVRLMFEGRNVIDQAETVMPGFKAIIQESKPETAEWMIKNAAAIAEAEKAKPGLSKLLARAGPDEGKILLENHHLLTTDEATRNAVGKDLVDTVNRVYKDAREALDQANRSLRPAEVTRLAGEVDQATALNVYMTQADEVGSLIARMKAEPELYPSFVRRKLELIHEGMIRDLNGEMTAEEAFNRINKARKEIDSGIKFGKKPNPEHVDAQRELKGLRSRMADSLEDTNVWGELGERQKAYQAAQSHFLNAEKIITEGPAFQKIMQKRVLPNGGYTFEANPRSTKAWINQALDEAASAKTGDFQNFMSAARGMADQIEASGGSTAGLRATLSKADQTLADIQARGHITSIGERHSGKAIRTGVVSLDASPGAAAAQMLVEQTAGRVLPGGVGHLAGQITGTIGKVRDPALMTGVLSYLDSLGKKTDAAIQSGVARIFGRAGKVAAADVGPRVLDSGSYGAAASSLRQHASDPARLAEALGQQTQDLHDHAPGTATSYQGTAARGVQHLASKLPDTGPQRPLDPPRQPSKAELAEVNRHLEIADSPARIFAHIREGTLTPDHLEALDTVYPGLGQEMRIRTMDQLATEMARGTEIPYRTRLSLSLFLGTDLESSTTQAHIAANQMALAAAEAADAAQKAGSSLGVKLDVAGRLQTPAQQANSRA